MAEPPVAIDADRQAGGGIEQFGAKRAVPFAALDQPQLRREPRRRSLIGRDARRRAQRQRCRL